MLSAARLAEIEQLVTGYQRFRERWIALSGNHFSKPGPAELAINDLLAEVKRLREKEAQPNNGLMPWQI